MKKMRSAARLKWMQTPWDRLSKEQLLLMVCRYHSALSTARCCLKQARYGNESSPYWKAEGLGGRAVAKADYLFHLCGDDTDKGSSEIYHQFFRYATDLLFPEEIEGWRWRWWICKGCGQMIANATNNPTKMCKCEGVEWRPLRMEDLRTDLAGADESAAQVPSQSRQIPAESLQKPHVV